MRQKGVNPLPYCEFPNTLAKHAMGINYSEERGSVLDGLSYSGFAQVMGIFGHPDVTWMMSGVKEQVALPHKIPKHVGQTCNRDHSQV